jgi:hypothetical protein
MSTTTTPRTPSPARHPPGGASSPPHTLTGNDAYTLTPNGGQHEECLRELSDLLDVEYSPPPAGESVRSQPRSEPLTSRPASSTHRVSCCLHRCWTSRCSGCRHSS